MAATASGGGSAPRVSTSTPPSGRGVNALYEPVAVADGRARILPSTDTTTGAATCPAHPCRGDSHAHLSGAITVAPWTLASRAAKEQMISRIGRFEPGRRAARTTALKSPG